MAVELDNQLFSNSTNYSIYPFYFFLNPYLVRIYIRSWLHKSLPYTHLQISQKLIKIFACTAQSQMYIITAVCGEQLSTGKQNLSAATAETQTKTPVSLAYSLSRCGAVSK